jgi:hypothetical protein
LPIIQPLSFASLGARASDSIMRLLTWGFACFALGCSSTERSIDPAGVVAEAPSASPSALAVANRLPLVSAATTAPLRARASSATSIAALPDRADAPVRFALDAGELTVRSLDARPAKGRDEGVVRRFAAVADDADLIHAQLRDAHEEAWILRSARAPHVLRWSLRAPPGLAFRLRERHVEAIDAAGVVRLSMAPPYLLDAAGTYRDVDLALELRADVRDGAAATLTLRVDGRGLSYPLAVDPVWTTAASFVTARYPGNKVVALAGGKAFIAGGARRSDAAYVSTAEIYDAATNKWSAAATAPFTLDGRALIVLTGGAKAGRVVAFQGGVGKGVAIYDPTANTWATAAASSVSISDYSLVSTGAKVLAPEIPAVFDSVQMGWVATGAKVFSSCENVSLLKDGRALCNESICEPANVQIYNPTTNLWASGAQAPTSHVMNSDTALLADGTLLVAGGNRSFGLYFAPSVAAETYDSTANAWTATANQLSQSGKTSLVLHPNGFVYAIGTSLLDVYQPSTRTFLEGEAPPERLASSVLLTDGSILSLPAASDVVHRLVPKALAATCSAPWECASGNCVTGVCCASAACATGFVCSSPLKPGTCIKVKGATCGVNADCDTGFCVDKRCCDRACGGACEACDVLGKEGTCTTIVGAPHGTRAACANDGTTCGAKTCDGVLATACSFPGGSVPCGSPSCTKGIESGLGVCGGGACIQSSRSCGAFLCGASTCKSTCTADTDCTAGYYCDKPSSGCIPQTSLGKKCDASTPCTAGLYCTDGVCCGKASCGAGSTCAWPTREGLCTRQNGSACALDAECGSGHCVDHVCCDGACGGQCEACDAPGSLGTCAPIAGKPHGARTACDATGAPCGERRCDATNRTSCVAFVGSEVACRDAGCSDGVVTSAAVCDGNGACPAATPVSCSGYKCDASGLACLDACTRDDQCLDAFKCAGGKCVARAAVCSGDGAYVVDVDGKATPCAPYACKAGSCLSVCTSSDDCTGGTLCDGASKTCVAPDSGDGGGGCSAAPGGGSTCGASALLAMLTMLTFSRLRARSRRASKEVV